MRARRAAAEGLGRRRGGLPTPTWCQFCAERLIFLTELGCSLFMSLEGGRGAGAAAGQRPLSGRSSPGLPHEHEVIPSPPPSPCCPPGFLPQTRALWG